jgi:hypothetical protein
MPQPFLDITFPPYVARGATGGPSFSTSVVTLALNKSATGKDASFALEDGFSARALFGLLGGDDFTIKVSPDGAVFRTALSIDKDTGHVGLARRSSRKLLQPRNLILQRPVHRPARPHRDRLPRESRCPEAAPMTHLSEMADLAWRAVAGLAGGIVYLILKKQLPPKQGSGSASSR